MKPNAAKLMGILLAIALLATVSTGLTSGEERERPLELAPGTWKSGIKVQNIYTDTVQVMVEFIDESGATVYATASSMDIDVGASVEFYLPNLADLPDGKYSAIVSSSGPVAAVVTSTDYEYHIADSYNSMDPASRVSVPYVYRDHNDWSTEIFVQNTSDASAEVFVSFSPSVKGNPHTESQTIPAKATRAFDTQDYTAMGSFIGTAVITSTEDAPLTAAANETRISTGAGIYVMTSLRGLTDADAGYRLVVPSLYRNFGTGRMWRSGIQIQNVSTTDTATVGITFAGDPDSPGGAGQTYYKTGISILPTEGYEFYLPLGEVDGGGYLPDAFKGSAIVESTGAPVVAAVLHTAYSSCTGSVCGVANSYIAAASGTNKLCAPSLYSNFGSGSYIWKSGLKFQNLSETDPATANITFTGDPDSPSGMGPWTKSGVVLDPGEAFEFYLPLGSLDGGGTLPAKFKGSAIVELTGAGGIAGTGLHTNYGRGVANIYNAVNY